MDIEMKAAGPIRAFRKNNKNIARRTGKPIKPKVSGTKRLILNAKATDPRKVEAKAVDLPITTFPVDTTGKVQLINGLVVGANAFQRIGRKISLLSVRMTGYIQWAQAGTTPSTEYLRVALVYDKQPDGVSPTWAQVFTTVDSGGTATSTSTAQPNLDNKDRFIILRDMRYKADFVTANAGGPPLIQPSAQTECKWVFDEFIRLKGIPTQYSATSNTGTVSDVQTGGLFVLTLGSSASVDTQYSSRIWTRVKYTDQ